MFDILKRQNPWWETGELNSSLFKRSLQDELLKNLHMPEILALLGSRQVGKTSLMMLMIQELLKTVQRTDIMYFNLDDPDIRQLFETPSIFLDYLGVFNEKKFIFIDEVQRLKNPGLFLKTLYDLKLNIKCVVSGSSQLEMRSKLKEFLVGRIRQFIIPRLSFREFQSLSPNTPQQHLLEEYLIWGGYPAVVLAQGRQEKQLKLRDLYMSYLQKDVADFAQIENTDAFHKLLILLAAQTGSLLNPHALSRTLKISLRLIEKYLSILEDTFIIQRLTPFFRNYKKELSKMTKVYFLDLGLRNYLLNAWGGLELRNDVGQLFENAVYLELLAQDMYQIKSYHYWRTTNQTEIDFVIEDGLQVTALEVKWGDSTFTPKSFKTFARYYPESTQEVITPDWFIKNNDAF